MPADDAMWLFAEVDRVSAAYEAQYGYPTTNLGGDHRLSCRRAQRDRRLGAGHPSGRPAYVYPPAVADRGRRGPPHRPARLCRPFRPPRRHTHGFTRLGVVTAAVRHVLDGRVLPDLAATQAGDPDAAARFAAWAETLVVDRRRGGPG